MYYQIIDITSLYLTKVLNNDIKIWNLDWLADGKIKKIISNTDIIKKNVLNNMNNIISKNEFDVFKYKD